MPKRSGQGQEPKPWRLLLWTALAGLICGLIGLGEYFEDALRVGRNGFHQHNASGQIVVVTIDEPALRKYGSWPWPRHYHGQLVDKLAAQGANRIFFDIDFSYPSNSADDRSFADALKRYGAATLASRYREGPSNGNKLDTQPLRPFNKFADEATLSVQYNYQSSVWRLPYALSIKGRPVPSIAAAIAGKKGPAGSEFPLDYSIRLSSIPVISAADVLSDRLAPNSLRGRQILIGTNSDVIGDRYFIPGYGRTGGVFIHAIGAETLRQGQPTDLGWLPGFLFALGAVTVAVLRRRFSERLAIFTGTTAALLIVPAFLEARLIFADITPGLFVVIVVASVLGWRRYRARGWVNSVSNLPNLSALRVNREGRSQALVAARVLNYEEIVSTLPAEAERQLIDQIVSRLRVGSPQRILYQGDAGSFAWFEESPQPVGNHLEAL